MWTRVRLDIGWIVLASTFLSTLRQCLVPESRELAIANATQAWGARTPVILTLSVRSGFDLLLRALQLPTGSEVLMSAWTIPDMVQIVRSHGLVPVPIDIDRRGHLNLDALREAISSKAKILVVAHLFGGRVPLDDIAQIAQQNGLLLVEDCAQAFRRIGDSGHTDSHVTMHSFGPIKTATALGGAVVSVSNENLRSSMLSLLESDPVQPSLPFACRVLRFSFLKLLTSRSIAALLWRCFGLLGIDGDRWLNSLGRGFSSHGLLSQLRKQPSQALLSLLSRRWKRYDFKRISRRMELAWILDEGISTAGNTAIACRKIDCFHTRWTYPLFVRNSSQLQDNLRKAGFDATSLCRMCVVPKLPDGRVASMAEKNRDLLFFLPWYPEMTDAAVAQLLAVVRQSADIVIEPTEFKNSAVFPQSPHTTTQLQKLP